MRAGWPLTRLEMSMSVAPIRTFLDFGGISLTNAGAYDAFVAMYNSSGAIQWARQAGGGTNGAFVGFYWDVALDRQTNVYAAGFLDSNAAVAKYDLAGTLLWTCSASGPPANPVGSVVAKCVVDSAANCYLAGWYQGTNQFGTNTLSGSGAWNFFLANVSSGAPLPPAVLAGFYITNAVVLPDGCAQFEVVAPSNGLYSLLLSTNLKTWDAVEILSGPTNRFLVNSYPQTVVELGNSFVARGGGARSEIPVVAKFPQHRRHFSGWNPRRNVSAEH